MKTISGIAIAGLTIAGLMFASSESFSQDACDHGGNHTIQVQEGADGKPELTYRGGSAEEVRVCMGDKVQWVVTGSDRSYLVEFLSIAPFDGAKSRGSSQGVVYVNIGSPFERGQQYAYGVEFDGGVPLDPHIIVE